MGGKGLDIVIISQYLRDIENFEDNNNRFVFLAKMLRMRHDVEIITSDFMHAPKTHAAKVGMLDGIRITALHEPGYPKNICLRRLYSHKQLANALEKYLRERKRPDVCYCAVPSLDVAESAARYCNKNGIRFIIDIQDLWPEAFKMVLRVPVLSDLIFAPMQRQADRIYALADEIVAVSKTYADRALRVNPKSQSSTAVFLGTEKKYFDRFACSCASKNDGVTVGYVGSMSASYDLPTVIDAIALIHRDRPIKLVAIGDGADREAFIEYAKRKKINAEFPGKLPYPQMVEQLMMFDIAVNPIRKGSAGSIINKVGDYAMAGLPVINTQESVEYRTLVDDYFMGYNCKNGDAFDVAEKLKMLMDSGKLRQEMGRNARKCAEERFDRENSYVEIVELLENESIGHKP